MININFRDPRPIYEQVRDSFRQLILSGVYPAGYKMPSVRELAAQLTINPIPYSGPTGSWRQRAISARSPAGAALSARRTPLWSRERRSCWRNSTPLSRNCGSWA